MGGGGERTVRGNDLWDPLKVESEKKKEITADVLLQIWDETGELGLEEQEEK